MPLEAEARRALIERSLQTREGQVALMVAMGDAIQRFVNWGNVMPETRRDLILTRARLESRGVDVNGFGTWSHGRTLGQLFEAMAPMKPPPIPCTLEFGKPAPTAWEQLLADDLV